MRNLKAIVSHNKKFEILDPETSEYLGLTVELLAPDNPAIKGKIRNLLDMRRHKAQRNQIVTASDDERASLEICKIAVVGWEWTKDKDGNFIGDWDGEQPEFSQAVLSDMLAMDWFRERIDREMNIEKGFF